MNAHPHRADIDCMVRQALVHNTMLAENPTSAYMLVQCLRTALEHNQAELIPSFFFQLESPTVVAYKNQQSSVVQAHIDQGKKKGENGGKEEEEVFVTEVQYNEEEEEEQVVVTAVKYI